ncbi:MAG: KTSC domain-containing protein [Vicinamibacterales bacterium]
MERRAVQSSMIRSWAFDEPSGILELEFTNGRIYQYTNVPEFLAKGFDVAASKGQYFQSRIDGRYAAQEVRQDSR